MKNKFNVEQFNYYFSILLAVIFIILNIHKKKFKFLFTFIIIGIIVFIFNKNKNIKDHITNTILFSIIISFVLYSLYNINRKNTREGFVNKIQKKGKKLKTKKVKEKFAGGDADGDADGDAGGDGDGEDADDGADADGADDADDGDGDDDATGDDGDDGAGDDNDNQENYVDAGTTFINAYKSLDKKAISGMTNDTKELINTQKNLMDTLKTLGPVVTEGKKVLDTFTNYFDK